MALEIGRPCLRQLTRRLHGERAEPAEVKANPHLPDKNRSFPGGASGCSVKLSVLTDALRQCSVFKQTPAKAAPEKSIGAQAAWRDLEEPLVPQTGTARLFSRLLLLGLWLFTPLSPTASLEVTQ